jgi:hypothetical protein
MIAAFVWTGAAPAAEGHVDVLAGGRTAPEAALEQPVEWEPEIEPSVLAAVVGSVQSFHGEAWWGVDGQVWGFAPETEATLLGLGPRAGVGADAGKARFELAGRYDAELYPVGMEPTNGRAEALASGAVDLGAARPFLLAEGVVRTYFVETDWSFHAAQVDGGVELGGANARVVLTGTWQINEGRDASGEFVPGQQVRGTIDVGISARKLEAFASYQLIHAWNGAADEAARSQFTPIGSYSSDADALSAGGFLQHLGEVGCSAEVGAWTFRGSALGRFRDADPGAASYANTFHGQLDVHRDLSERTTGILTLGASAAEVVSGQSFVDLYGWVGLSYELGPRDDATP